jgi:hypothetical protein
MKILNERVETKLIDSNKKELSRIQTTEGTIYWLKYIGNLRLSGALHKQYIVSGSLKSSLSISDSDWRRLGRFSVNNCKLVFRSSGLVIKVHKVK